MEAAAKSSRRAIGLRIALLVLVVGAGVALFASGAHRHIDLDGMREAVRSAGPFGGLLFVVAFALLQPLHVSAHLFMVVATLLWSPVVAFSLSWVGVMGASVCAFGFARSVGREWMQERIPERLRRYDKSLSEGGLRAVIVMKLLFFATPTVQFAFGVSRVSFRNFAIGTAIGNTPTVLVVTALGGWLATQW